MARPAVAEFTDDWWSSLPEVYRAADEAQADGPNSFPLLRFLSLLGDQADEISVLYDRFALHDDGTGDYVSDLANPETADTAWLAWLAPLAGVGLRVGLGSAESFDQLVRDYSTFADLAANNVNFTMVRHHADFVPGGAGPDVLRQALLNLTGYRFAGSTGAWERLLEPYLTGAKRVIHQRIYTGDAWHLRLTTYLAETPDPTRLAYVIGQAVKAAGLVVDYDTRQGASFAEVATGFASFAAIPAALASFADLDIWLPPP